MNQEYLNDNFDASKLSFSSVKEEQEFCSELAELFYFMPGAPEVRREVPPKWLLKKNIDSEVVFYPGTFNPWHLGHRACLDLCPSKNIVVVPDFNPWKEGEPRQRPWEHFKDLLYRLSETDYSIYPGFLAKEQGNPTVDWLPKVTVPKKSLLIGDDSFLSFHKWKNVEELIKHINVLYVAPRGSDALLLEEQTKKFPGLRIVFLDHHDYEDLSSTGIRNKKGS